MYWRYLTNYVCNFLRLFSRVIHLEIDPCTILSSRTPTQQLTSWLNH